MIPIPPNHILTKYGLSREDYIRLWDLCYGRCPLCTKKFSKLRPACIDHSHSDWLVRGLLCRQCNRRIGENHDDAGWLERAARYLRNPPAILVLGITARHKDAPPIMEKH
jgi:hypothetical protein